MPPQIIPIAVKKRCVEMRREGYTSSEIYHTYFKLEVEDPQSRHSFCTSLNRWMRQVFPDDLTLESGTYAGFTAHGATVQVSANGEIVQAWIKQHADEFTPDDFLAALKEQVEPYAYTPKKLADSKNMLEIPLFDMHWGIAFMSYYEPKLNEILDVIADHYWDEIVILFGQDFFHNDSIVNGQTTKGTNIEKVNMIKAVKEGQVFMNALIESALVNANSVSVVYTPGNHDQSISWMFMQTLLAQYGPFVVDDSMRVRKCITYGKNSIMITHGDSKQANPKNLAHVFPISFPKEFANANIREVHAGHLHHESDSDIFGIMVRRLSSGNKLDDWSDKEDYVGTHKRFMLFEWSPEKLKGIYYI